MIALLRPFVLALIVAQAAGSHVSLQSEKGEIRGRVTDMETGQPLPRVIVRLSGPAVKEMTATTTEAAGIYRFAGLAAGQYNIWVEPGQSRATHIMESFTNAAGRPQPVVLNKDETREVNVALPRARAVNIRVVDPWGEPLSGLHVSLLPADTADSGGQALVLSQHATDDKGRLRIFRVAPGRYIACADVYTGGSPAGDGPPARRDRLLRTCYPSAGDEREAEPIQVDRADVGELELRMRIGRTFTISGRILDASGGPFAGLAGLTRYYRNGSSGSGFRTDADGRFRIDNVHPGGYAIEVSLGGPERPEQRRPLEAGFLPVIVESSDIDDLVVLMKKTVDVAGRFTLEDPSSSLGPPLGSGLAVAGRLADDRLPNAGSGRWAYARADRSFTLTGMVGSRVLQIENVPRGWYVKSIRYGTREIIDEPVEFKGSADPPSLDVVLSNRGAVVTGRVIDDRGNPARATVLMFRMRGTEAPPTLATSATTSAAGAFRLGPARAGDYSIVAVPATTSPLQPGERERSARLAAPGERISLGELDERTVELRIAVVK